jgi:hypothetical protein
LKARNEPLLEEFRNLLTLRRKTVEMRQKDDGIINGKWTLDKNRKEEDGKGQKTVLKLRRDFDEMELSSNEEENWQKDGNGLLPGNTQINGEREKIDEENGHLEKNGQKDLTKIRKEIRNIWSQKRQLIFALGRAEKRVAKQQNENPSDRRKVDSGLQKINVLENKLNNLSELAIKKFVYEEFIQ